MKHTVRLLSRRFPNSGMGFRPPFRASAGGRHIWRALLDQGQIQLSTIPAAAPSAARSRGSSVRMLSKQCWYNRTGARCGVGECKEPDGSTGLQYVCNVMYKQVRSKVVLLQYRSPPRRTRCAVECYTSPVDYGATPDGVQDTNPGL